AAAISAPTITWRSRLGTVLSLGCRENPPRHVCPAPALDRRVPRSCAKGLRVAFRQSQNLVQPVREDGLVALGKARQVPERGRVVLVEPLRDLREARGVGGHRRASGGGGRGGA